MIQCHVGSVRTLVLKLYMNGTPGKAVVTAELQINAQRSHSAV